MALAEIGLKMTSVLSAIARIPDEFDSDAAVDMFEQKFDFLQYVVVLYVLLVCYGPQTLERLQHGPPPHPAEDAAAEAAWQERRARREVAFQARVKVAMRLWNLLLAVFSCLGGVSSFHLVGYLVRSRTFFQINCDFDYTSAYDGACAFWVFAFMVSKIPEMMDTVFLVLQKKKVIFLHSYHHLTVTIFCWCAGRRLFPAGLLFTAMNYWVHTVMYTYYFLSSFRPLRRALSVVAPAVTFLQILQMILGFWICVYVSYYSFVHNYGTNGMDLGNGVVAFECKADAAVTRMGLLMYGSYFFLFVMLFSSKYMKGRKRRSTLADSK